MKLVLLTAALVGDVAAFGSFLAAYPNPNPTKFMSKDALREAVEKFNTDKASAEKTHGLIADWDVSYISNMRTLFSSFETFDANISNWDTSSVTDMTQMFRVRSARALRPPQPPVLNPTLKRAARAAAASHALPPPDPYLAPHRLPSLRLGRARRCSTSR